jgi:shikimate dehydrogenase
MKMKKLGLIGYPLGHSFSKKYFTEKFVNESVKDYSYNNYPIQSTDELHGLLEREKELIGLNVTIPYKQEVIKFLNEMDETAREIGAVNTIKINRKENTISMKGYNTDAFGFEKPLLEVLDLQKSYKGIILGTGGASKAVAYIFQKNSIGYIYVSRTPKKENQISYSELTPELLSEHRIIVNTSPLGMYPGVNNKPDIPYDAIGSNHILYDLIYNPLVTAFLKEGQKRNAKTINGLTMLHLQAEKAWEIWTTRT